MSSQRTAAASNRAAVAKIREVVGRVNKQDTAITAPEAKNAAQGATIDHQAGRIKRLENNKDHSVQFTRLVQAELEAHKKRMDVSSRFQFSYTASGVAPPEDVLDDTNVDLINDASGNGVNSIDLSAQVKEIQKNTRLKAVVNQTLHNMYGVPRLRGPRHLEYSSVPMEDDKWPSTTDDQVASTLLPALTREDVLTGCELWFTYLRGQYRRKKAGAINTSTDQAGAPAPNVPNNQQIDPTQRHPPWSAFGRTLEGKCPESRHCNN
ncbi:hypothetical protein FRC12_021914 [Ceratobasidium sp. 428]|nr:hypothetical protein FRC12_021914 [Ceratobasidium sp. 428]